MDYEKKYKEALEKARQFSEHPLQEDSSSIVEYIFPELKDSEDEKIIKALIRFHKSTIDVDGIKGEDILAWLEKQGSNLVKNGYTDNKDIIKYADNYSHEIWRKLMDNFENIKDYHIGCNDVSDIVLNAIIDAYNWLEKQGEQKETLCDKCRKEQPSHSCQDITSLGRCALEKQGERIKLLLNKKGENVQDLIEKYVSDHADCRWLDASELEQLLNDFVLEYDIIKNREYEQQCKVSNDGNNR